MKRLFIVMCGLTLLTGCSGVTGWQKALAKDPAAVRVRALGMGYSFEYERAMPWAALTNSAPVNTVINDSGIQTNAR